MPIYEYQCPQCQTVFEEWLSVSEATDKAPCPECQTESSRIISNTAFVLKGGGWYVTEYGNRKNADGGATTTKSSETSTTSSTGSGGSEKTSSTSTQSATA